MTTEQQTARDGVLSYSGEWHGLGVGVVIGVLLSTGHRRVAGNILAAAWAKETTVGHLRDARKELAYTGGGIAAGVALTELTEHL